MNLPALAVKRPVATGTILLILLLIGVVSLWQTPLDLLPEIQPPVLAVVTIFPGSSPQETLSLVTEPMEDMISTISGLNNLNSFSQENMSLIVLQFDWGTAVKDVRDSVSSRLDLLTLPEGVQRPIIIEFDPTMMPIMQVAVSGEEDLLTLSNTIEESVVPRIETVPGVASVNASGTVTKELFVRLYPDKLIENGLSFDQVTNVLRASILDFPAGIKEIDDRDVRLRFLGRMTELSKIEDLVVGFQVDEKKLDDLLGKSINIDLGQMLGGSESGLTDHFKLPDFPDLSLEDIPLKDLRLKDIASQITIDRENNLVIIVSDTAILNNHNISSLYEVLKVAILDYLDRNPGQGINLPDLWKDIRLPGGLEKIFPEDYLDEVILLLSDYLKQLEKYLVPDVREQLEDMLQTPLDEAMEIIGDYPINTVFVPLAVFETMGYHDALEMGNMVLTSIPDLEGLADLILGGFDIDIGSGIGDGLGASINEASKAAEDMLIGLMKMFMFSSMGMGNGDLPGMEGESFPIDPIYLSSVAEVSNDIRPSGTITRINGQPSISLIIQKEGGANTVSVSRDIRRELDEVSESLQAVSGDTEDNNINFFLTYDQASEIEEALMDLAWALLGGAVLAISVLLLFLRNWRTTLFIGISIPVAIIFTFTLLYFSNITINLMTLGGLALAAGLLVDNAIVVSENIYRHFQMGKESHEAAIDGTKEVSGAIIASTLTTLSVFFPVVFLTGLAGELFWEFALTVSCALFASLIIALTVLPMLASRFLSAKYAGDEITKVAPSYRRILNKTMKHRVPVLLGGVLFLGVGALLFNTMGTDLFPVPEESSFTVDIALPPGTALGSTDDYVKQAESIIKEYPEVSMYSARIGEPRFFGLATETGVSNQAVMRVRISDGNTGEIEGLMEELRVRLSNLPGDAELSFNRENLLDTAGLEVRLELTVEGDNLDAVQIASTMAAERLKIMPELTDIKSVMEETRPEIHMIVNQPKALEKGITVFQVGMLTRQAMEGVQVGRLETEEEGILNLVVGLHKDSITSIEELQELGFRTEMGSSFQLGDVATFSEAYGPLSIPRENKKVVGQVQAQYRGMDLGSVTDRALEAIGDVDLPPDVVIRPSGTSSLMDDAFGELELVFLLAAALVYLVMAAQFESLKHPFIIICSLPLAFTGAIIALSITDNSLSIPAMIGGIVLAGILVNDGIIMVDFINQKRRIDGMALSKAIIEGASARLRPILMTTITTILGLVPLALGIGQGSQIQAPMAIAIIGGQITGTLLLLVIIPALYSIIEKRGSDKNILNELLTTEDREDPNNED